MLEVYFLSMSFLRKALTFLLWLHNRFIQQYEEKSLEEVLGENCWVKELGNLVYSLSSFNEHSRGCSILKSSSVCEWRFNLEFFQVCNSISSSHKECEKEDSHFFGQCPSPSHIKNEEISFKSAIFLGFQRSRVSRGKSYWNAFWKV